jgi:hypothetical protein
MSLNHNFNALARDSQRTAHRSGTWKVGGVRAISVGGFLENDGVLHVPILRRGHCNKQERFSPITARRPVRWLFLVGTKHNGSNSNRKQNTPE